MPFELDCSASRRNALKVGGLAVSLAALAAACGEDREGDDAPGRVGSAPVPTALPDYPVDDIVLLRAASSLEYTAVDVYETILAVDGALPSDVVPVVERLIEDHQMVADTMNELIVSAGGDPWTCANPWLMERLVEPALELIQSNVVGVVLEDISMVQVLAEEAVIAPVVSTAQGDIPLLSPTDDLSQGDELEFGRLEGAVPEDVIAFANALESIAAASHQELASATSIIEARVAHLDAAILEARHAAVLAIATYGPEGYISPALIGEDVVPTDRSQIRQFAIPSTFGLTSQIETKAGPGDINAVRVSVIMQTPAENTLVYNELTCDA
jgi:hypothetical protein